MKSLTLMANLMLSAITCAVVFTEGMATSVIYIALTASLIVIPILNSFLLYFFRPIAKRLAITLSLFLIAFTCWAFIDQYPHPDGVGIMIFTLFVLFVPSLNIVIQIRIDHSTKQAQAA